jgi:predicted amidohydrolase
MTRVVCQQLAPRIADLQANQERSVRAVAEAVDAGADVVVLPELVTSGYVFESIDEAAAVAITPQHAVFAEWAAEAVRGSAVVVGGFCEQGDDGLLYNSAAVVDGSGVLGVYRKTHLWDREKLFFQPGAQAPRVFDTSAGRIGVLVCYDLEFPELTRLLALAGAELIVVPTKGVDGRHHPHRRDGMGHRDADGRGSSPRRDRPRSGPRQKADQPVRRPRRSSPGAVPSADRDVAGRGRSRLADSARAPALVAPPGV